MQASQIAVVASDWATAGVACAPDDNGPARTEHAELCRIAHFSRGFYSEGLLKAQRLGQSQVSQVCFDGSDCGRSLPV